jgi:hypothetical protein
MWSSIAGWAATVVATGVVAGSVVVLAAAAGLWWLRRWIRRRLAVFAVIMADRVPWSAAGNARAGWERLVALPDHRWPTPGRPEPR